MTEKKLGLSFSVRSLLRRLRRYSRSVLGSTPLTTGDLDSLTRAFSEPVSGTYFLTCGAKIVTARRASATLPMRAVASCSCLSTNLRGLATTIDGMNMARCPLLKDAIRVIIEENTARKVNSNASGDTEVRGSAVRRGQHQSRSRRSEGKTSKTGG